MGTLSADCDLSQDIANLINNDGVWVGSSTPGIPQNGPESYSAGWMIRGNFWAGTPYTGYMQFENEHGQWARAFTRDPMTGSTSYAAWVQTANYRS